MFLFKGVVLDKTLTLFENVSRLFLFALSMYLHCGQAGNTHRHNQIYCRSKVQEYLNAVVKFTWLYSGNYFVALQGNCERLSVVKWFLRGWISIDFVNVDLLWHLVREFFLTFLYMNILGELIIFFFCSLSFLTCIALLFSCLLFNRRMTSEALESFLKEITSIL